MKQKRCKGPTASRIFEAWYPPELPCRTWGRCPSQITDESPRGFFRDISPGLFHAIQPRRQTLPAR